MSLNEPAPNAAPAAPAQKNWFARHKVITGIGAFVAVAVIVSPFTGGSGKSKDTASEKAASSSSVKASTPVINATAKAESTPAATAPVVTPVQTTEPVVPAPPAPKPKPAMTAGQEQAVGSAQDYLRTSHFSKQGLIDQLSSQYGDDFSRADATFAVEHIKVNWNEQAKGAALDYLRTDHFSHSGLVSQLSSAYGDKFTRAQAEYGVTAAGL